MKLSDYAKQMGVRYETAWRWFRDGKIQGRRVGPHTIIITEGRERRRERGRERRRERGREGESEGEREGEREGEKEGEADATG